MAHHTIHTWKANTYGDGEEHTLSIIFDKQIPELKPSTNDWSLRARELFGEEAKSVVDAMCGHAPQGLVDFIFAELAKRKASVIHCTEK